MWRYCLTTLLPSLLFACPAQKDVFLLKDLEKFVPKEKGLPFQTVKEILNSLVGDDLVDTDKIGTSTYFWAFPSKAYNKVSILSQLFTRLIVDISLLSRNYKN